MRKTFMFIIAALFAGTAYSHPHVFISPYVKINITGGVIEQIEVDWVFDEMTGGSMIEFIDSNSDGEVSREESKKIREEVFPSLASYNYYAEIRADKGKPVKIKPGPLEIAVEDGILRYIFSAPLGIETGMLFLSFDDPDFYTAFEFGAGNVSVYEAGVKKEGVKITQKEKGGVTGVYVELKGGKQ